DRLREVAGPARIITLLNGSEQERFAQLQVARLNGFDDALVAGRGTALRAANHLLFRVRRREVALVNDVPGQLPLPLLQFGDRAAVIERLCAHQPPPARFDQARRNRDRDVFFCLADVEFADERQVGLRGAGDADHGRARQQIARTQTQSLESQIALVNINDVHAVGVEHVPDQDREAVADPVIFGYLRAVFERHYNDGVRRPRRRRVWRRTDE